MYRVSTEKTKGTVSLEFKKCPYCNKRFEVELRGGDIEVEVRKEEDSIMPKDSLERMKLREKLEKKGLLDKMELVVSAVRRLSKHKEKGASYDNIKALVQKESSLSEEDIKDIIEVLKREGDIFEIQEGFFKTI